MDLSDENLVTVEFISRRQREVCFKMRHMNNGFPQDSGPLYAETQMRLQSREPGFWFEPFNTWSNLLFLPVLLIFSWRLLRARRKPPLFLLCLPLLAGGFIGGVLYHGMRSWDVWYYLDFVPILVISQVVAFYFWYRSGKVVTGVFLMLVVQALFLTVKWWLPAGSPVQGTLFYVPLALNVLIAALVFSRHPDFRRVPFLISGVLIAIALFFRQIDLRAGEIFPWGTHFLWHIFGALSTYFLCEVLWRLESRREPKAQSS